MPETSYFQCQDCGSTFSRPILDFGGARYCLSCGGNVIAVSSDSQTNTMTCRTCHHQYPITGARSATTCPSCGGNPLVEGRMVTRGETDVWEPLPALLDTWSDWNDCGLPGRKLLVSMTLDYRASENQRIVVDLATNGVVEEGQITYDVQASPSPNRVTFLLPARTCDLIRVRRVPGRGQLSVDELRFAVRQQGLAPREPGSVMDLNAINAYIQQFVICRLPERIGIRWEFTGFRPPLTSIDSVGYLRALIGERVRETERVNIYGFDAILHTDPQQLCDCTELEVMRAAGRICDRLREQGMGIPNNNELFGSRQANLGSAGQAQAVQPSNTVNADVLQQRLSSLGLANMQQQILRGIQATNSTGVPPYSGFIPRRASPPQPKKTEAAPLDLPTNRRIGPE